MSVILIGIWLGLLAVLVKVGVFKKWALWMKLSPIFIYLMYFVIIAIPMNFTAPQGDAVVLRESVQISPAVSGIVSEVLVLSGTQVNQGDLLFTIDPAPYEAAVANLEAQLELAETRLAQAATLVASQSGSIAQVQQYEAEVDQVAAQLEGARWNFEQTRVVAPSAGKVPHVALEPGSLVNPGAPVLSLINSERFVTVGRIAQNYVRHVEPGQKADLVLKLLPGQVVGARVLNVVDANSVGQLVPSGLAMDTQNWTEQPFVVSFELENGDDFSGLPAGAFGTVAIYTSDMSSFGEIIRAIMLRTETWLNYL